ncbi:MAG: peptidoglycan-binding domain-containing protein [Minisyncoccota bacterium]
MKKVAGVCLLGVALFGFIFFFRSGPTFAASVSFNRPLLVGSSGEDVRALQQILNEDVFTRIASTGPGSPGQETTYFGYLTQKAVIRFQEKYASEILFPTGLAQGTGYVGSYTITKLNALSAVATSVGSTSSPTTLSTIASQNPNLAQLDYVISVVNKREKQQGVADQEISTLDQDLRDVMATTTDLTAEFLSQASIRTSTGALGMQPDAPQDFLTKLLIALGIMQPAYAATGVPFGGTLAAAVPCTCTGGYVWLLTMKIPLPPSYAELLADIPTSQLYLSKVPTPHTAESFLGFYAAGAPSCVMGAPPFCFPIYTWGTVEPFVGSSL